MTVFCSSFTIVCFKSISPCGVKDSPYLVWVFPEPSAGHVSFFLKENKKYETMTLQSLKDFG